MKPTFRILTTWLILLSIIRSPVQAQRRWDGGAGDGQWSSALNWQPDGVPAPGEDVILDNRFVSGGFTVTLPSGSIPVSIHSLAIQPQPGDSILFDIPPTNTAIPALDLSSIADALILDAGAILRNSSGAASGETIQLPGLLVIHDGGRYIHRTARANAYLIDHLSTDSSTAHGIFEFDVPGNAGYTVSLTGNNFGDLRFSATAAGGSKSYSGSGTTDLSVRGQLSVGPGAQLTSTLTADIRVSGDMDVDGTLNLHPVTAGGTGRRLLFLGAPVHASGAGTISLGQNFRGIECSPGSSVILDREFILPLAAQTWWLRGGATLDLGIRNISGPGAFRSEAGATLRIGDPYGITTGDAGNLRTAIRLLDTGMIYMYTGTGDQYTGNALPTSVAGMGMDKASGQLVLSTPVEVKQLRLINGILRTSDSSMVTIAGDIVSLQDAFGRTDEGWEKSHVHGPCIIRTTGTGTWRAPTGNGSSFAPIALRRGGTGSVSYTCAYHSGAAASTIGPGSFTYINDKEYWTVRSSGSSPEHDARIDLSWRRQDWPLIDSIGVQTLHIAGIDSSQANLVWTLQDRTPLVEDLGGVGWVHADIATATFGSFTLGTIMPMNLLAMTGLLSCRAETGGNALRWTGSMISGEEMHIESSVDGKQFHELTGMLQPDSYFVDKENMEQDIWYRTSIIGLDGKELHSNTCLVHRDQSARCTIYPQPAWDHINLNAAGILHDVRYRLLDISGKPIQEGHLPDASAWTINMDHPVPGIRVLQVFHAGGMFTLKVLIGQAK